MSRSRSQFFLLNLVFMLVSLQPLALWAQTTVQIDSCFRAYAENNRERFMDFLPRCLDEIRTTTPGVKNINIHIRELKEIKTTSPTNPILQTVSQKAADVYYEDSFCNTDPALGIINCGNLWELSQLHESGFYRYDCARRMPSHNKCSDFSKFIIQQRRDICNRKGINHKVYCNQLITGFLNAGPCLASSTQEACEAHVQSRLPTDPCGLENFDVALCTGGSTGDISAASVEAPVDATGKGDETTTGDTSGNADAETPGTETPSNDPLSQAAQSLGQRFFGGNNLMNASAPSGSLNVPDSNATTGLSAKFANPQGLSPVSVGSVPVAQAYPSSQLLPPNTRGEPGGQANDAGGSGGAGGRGTPGFGGGSGGQGMGQAGRANPGGGRGGYSGGSRLKDILDKMSGSFLSTNGAGGATPGSPTAALNESIKKQIEKNKLKDPDYKNRVRSAYRQGLAGSGNSPVLDAVYFPSVRKAYENLQETQQILNETGR